MGLRRACRGEVSAMVGMRRNWSHIFDLPRQDTGMGGISPISIDFIDS
jgi:hypothetical protein